MALETKTEITMVADPDVVRPRSPGVGVYVNVKGQMETILLVTPERSEHGASTEALLRFRRTHEAGQRGTLPLDDPGFLQRRLDGLDG